MYLMNRFLNKYSSAVRAIKLRIIKWATHIARMGEVRNAHETFVRKLEERDHMDDQGVERKIKVNLKI
jgi:hypothetical protein